MFRAMLLSACAWLVLGFAPPSQPPAADVASPADCRDDDGVDRCDPEQQRRVRDRFGVKSIEAHRDSGDQVRRAFYVDGLGNDVVAIVFIRAKGEEPQLQVHFPRRSDGVRAEPLRAPLPQAIWDMVLERSELFDRRLVPVSEARPCLNPWIYTVEAADPPKSGTGAATLRRRTEGGCQAGLAKVYARELHRVAVSLLPACARLDLRGHPEEGSLLLFCGMLAGDRLAAAEVLNRTAPFRLIRQAGDWAQLGGLFEAAAIVDWNGERNSGYGTAAKFWAAKATAGGGTFFYERIEGKSPDLVHLRGSLVRWADVPESEGLVPERARFEQVWTRDQGEFAVRSVTVGPFQRQPRR